MVRRLHVISALVLAVLLAACGGSTTGDTGAGDASESTAGAGAAATAEPGSAGSAAPAANELDGTATLRYGAANAPSRLDPHRSSSGYDQNWLAPAYERLIHQTPEAESEPGLATEWDFVDPTTFEMTLREGVVFHDGQPFDAPAVKANIERAQTIEGSGVKSYLLSVAAVEVVDPTHVRFLLNKPDSTLPNQLATRPGMMISPAAFANPDIDTRPVGTGMFKIVEYRERDRAIFERNEQYWGEPAKVAGLEIVYLADPVARTNALVSGEVDAAVIEPLQVQQAEDAGMTVQFGESLELWHLFVNRTASEFGDVKVRQAMEHAIDRQALVDVLWLGYGRPSNQWVPEGTPYWSPEIGEDYYPYDPERSRQLLAEAGLPDGFAFEMLVANLPIFVQGAEILQAQFADVGIDVTLRQVEASQTSDLFFVRKEGVILLASAPGRVDPSELASIYFHPESFSNPGGHTTPETLALYEESLATFEDPAKTENRQALVAQFTKDALDPVLFYPDRPLASNERVTGIEWYLSGHIEFGTVGMTAS